MLLGSCSLSLDRHTKPRVTFNLNYSDAPTPPVAQEVESGSLVPRPSDPVREEFSFSGWYQESSCENIWDFERDEVTQDITLYAKWTPVPSIVDRFEVVFNLNYSGATGAPTTQTIPTGDNATRPADPIRTGFSFGGWYQEPSCESIWIFEEDKVTEAITLYAKWVAVTLQEEYSVSFSLNYADSPEGPPTQAVLPGGVLSPPEDPVREGYTFGGWYREETCLVAWNFTADIVTENRVLYAKWTVTEQPEEYFTVSFNLNYAGALEPPQSQTIILGGTVTRPSDPSRNGYLFGGWYRDVEGAFIWNFSSDVVEGNRILYAKWSLITSRIVADHTVVDRYDDIPQHYIDLVKQMWFNLPGESHSSGYRMGLQFLAEGEPRFAVNVTESGTPEGSADTHLRVSRAYYSLSSKWVYGTGESKWYTNSGGITETKGHLDFTNLNDNAPSAFGFGWCWDMTWGNAPGGTVDPVYKVRWAGTSVGGPEGDRRWGLDSSDYSLTGNTVCMTTYLEATQEYADYCVAQGYETKVFFTTGPVDGYAGENGYQRQLKHDYIRSYVGEEESRILFDYADILAWDGSNRENSQSWTDSVGVAHSYQMIAADNMLDRDGSYREDGDHIGERGAIRLAKAVWWMLARMAGWDGVSAD